MSSSVADFDTSLDAVMSAVETLPTELAVARELDDAALLQAQHRIAAARAKLDACASLLAGETGYRSRHDRRDDRSREPIEHDDSGHGHRRPPG